MKVYRFVFPKISAGRRHYKIETVDFTARNKKQAKKDALAYVNEKIGVAINGVAPKQVVKMAKIAVVAKRIYIFEVRCSSKKLKELKPKESRSMKIPVDILKKVEEVLKKRSDQKEKERKAAEQRVKEVQELKDLKKEHYAISRKRAGVILDWVRDFMASSDSKKIFKIADEVNIFVANFWGGKPQLGKIYATWAVIALNKEGRLRYIERHKGRDSSEVRLGSAPPSPVILAENLHPEFLKQWEEAIRSKKVWDYIRHSLPKYF